MSRLQSGSYRAKKSITHLGNNWLRNCAGWAVQGCRIDLPALQIQRHFDEHRSLTAERAGLHDMCKGPFVDDLRKDRRRNGNGSDNIDTVDLLNSALPDLSS